MIQEDKQLLLKDLCARLPYRVKVKTPYNVAEFVGIVDRKGVRKDIDYTDIVTDKQTYPLRYCQPYLRPMSNMTEEECDKVEEILGNDCIFDFMGNGDIVLHKGNFTQKTLSKLYDFYNSIHVDYHTDDEGKTMIERGLAIEVTEENNPYKE